MSSESIVCLFVGGPADGERIAVLGHWSAAENQYIPLKSVRIAPRCSPFGANVWCSSQLIEHVEYLRCELVDIFAKKIYWVYFAATNDKQSPIQGLIDGYKPNSQS